MSSKFVISAFAIILVASCAGFAWIIKANLSPSGESAAFVETRCGWFENPTPANAWLIDRDGEWLISAQGGYQADGDWPDFSDSQWVETNGPHGYGCACISVTANRAKKRIIKIKSARARPLSVCRNDPSLKRKEPK